MRPIATVRKAQRPGRRRRAVECTAAPISIDGRRGPVVTRGMRTASATDGLGPEPRSVGRMLARRRALAPAIRPRLATEPRSCRATNNSAALAVRARRSARSARSSCTTGRRSLMIGRISSTIGSTQGRARSKSGRATSGTAFSRPTSGRTSSARCATRGRTSSARCALISFRRAGSDSATLEAVSAGVFIRPFNAGRASFLRFLHV
jgi:hypothetical protein